MTNERPNAGIFRLNPIILGQTFAEHAVNRMTNHTLATRDITVIAGIDWDEDRSKQSICRAILQNYLYNCLELCQNLKLMKRLNKLAGTEVYSADDCLPFNFMENPFEHVTGPVKIVGRRGEIVKKSKTWVSKILGDQHMSVSRPLEYSRFEEILISVREMTDVMFTTFVARNSLRNTSLVNGISSEGFVEGQVGIWSLIILRAKSEIRKLINDFHPLDEDYAAREVKSLGLEFSVEWTQDPIPAKPKAEVIWHQEYFKVGAELLSKIDMGNQSYEFKKSMFENKLDLEMEHRIKIEFI